MTLFEQLIQDILKDEQLYEAKQVGILYHYTSLESLVQITNSNMLRQMGYDGVSLTRDKNFHKWDRESIPSECRFIIDGDKLSHNFKIEPFNYYANDKDAFNNERPYNHTPYYDEQEEVVKRPIKPLNKYVIQLQIFEKVLNEYYDNEYFDSVHLDQYPTKDDFIEFLEEKFKVELL